MELYFTKWNKAIELSILSHNGFSRGINIISFDAEIGFKGDHNPSLFIDFIILNWIIFSINLYNLRYEEDKYNKE